MHTRPKVYIAANPAKLGEGYPLQRVLELVGPRGEVLASDFGRLDPDRAAQADRVIVLGGDGTILGAGRAMGERQAPLIGINLGKLGYLAVFSLEDLEKHIDRVLSDDRLISRRMMLEVVVAGPDGPKLRSMAINDCVLQAGPPFRMIHLALCLNDSPLTHIAGDGIIVATPVGSTAYNLSAGGPILQPTVRAMAITPIAAHSLTLKPVVVDSAVSVRLVPERINEGTRIILDGQEQLSVAVGDTVTIRKHPSDLLLVENPDYPPWYTLVAKLKWGVTPARS